MLSEPELYVRCSNILQPSYFDKKNSGAVGFMHQYSEKHNGLPSTTIVNAKLKTKYEQLGEIATSHKEWFLESIEDFCKSPEHGGNAGGYFKRLCSHYVWLPGIITGEKSI